MRRALAVAAPVLVLAVAVALAVAGSAPGVPTLRLERRELVRTVTAEGALRAVRSTPLTAPVDAEEPFRIGWLIEDGTQVTAGDLVIRFDATDLATALEGGRADRASAEHKLSRADAERAAATAGLARDAEQAGREVEHARSFQSTDDEIYSRFEIVSSGIDADLAESRRQHAQARTTTRAEVARGERALLEIERRKADLVIERAERGLAALEVRAPHDGIAVLLRDWRGNLPRVGDTAYPGQKLAEIPRLEQMEAEVYVLEADAGGLAAGATATLVVDGRPGEAWPAEVARVDSIAKPRFRGVPVQYFAAVLSLERDGGRSAKPGQRVHATIEVARRPDAIVVPRQAVAEREGASVVWRRNAWRRFQPVEVELGPASLGRVVVEKGLEAGDVIALVDPTRPAPRGSATPSPAGGRP